VKSDRKRRLQQAGGGEDARASAPVAGGMASARAAFWGETTKKAAAKLEAYDRIKAGTVTASSRMPSLLSQRLPAFPMRKRSAPLSHANGSERRIFEEAPSNQIFHMLKSMLLFDKS